jgi:hypothetical protein
MPPLAQCQITREDGGPVNIRWGGELRPLELKILRGHIFSWNVEGRILTAPQMTAWWAPYDREAIMRYGNTVNSSIPADVDQAEFPREPGPDRVTIRIKSQAPPQNPTAPLPAGGDPSIPGPGLPLGWRGAALGQAQPISEDPSGLVNYSSPNQGQDGQQMGDNNNNIYLVWPQRGTWLHLTTALSAGCGVVHAKYPLSGDGCLAVRWETCLQTPS